MRRRLGMAIGLSLCVSAPLPARDPAPPSPPAKAWTDTATGHRIVRVDDRPGNYALYFNYNPFTPDGSRMVYLTPEGIRVANVKDWSTRLALRAKIDRLLFVGHRTAVAYYTLKPASTEEEGPFEVWSLDLDTGARRKIASMPGGRIESINADDTLLSGHRELEPPPPAIAAQGRRDPKTGAPAYSGTDASGRPLSFAEAKAKWMDARLEAHVPMEIFAIDTRTGTQRTIHRATDWLNHVQFSPTDPGLLLFCHEGPWHKVDRLWTIRTDGTALTKVHTRTMQGEIAGHEFWSPDGRTIWYDLQTPKGKLLWLAGYDVGTGARRWYRVEPDQWSVHYTQSPDGRLFAGDGGGQGKYISLFHPRPDPDGDAPVTLDAEHLIATGTLETDRVADLAKQDYTLEPNLHFTPDGRWLVYRGNGEGTPAIYAVDLGRPR